MLNKFFFITVDTEGDNLWSMPSVVTTQNALFLERFQRLCNRYGFYPIYLTNYEMEHDEAYVEFARHYLQRELCEIGMHLHAWNMPPKYELIRGAKYHNAYLIEYPVEIMEEKIKLLTDELEDAFQTKIISHRAGRWATNRRYFELLEKYGYKVDCSVTPYVDWRRHVGYTEGSGGSDYRKSACGIGNAYEGGTLIEIPVTIRKTRMLDDARQVKSVKDFLRNSYHLICGKKVWIRPTGHNLVSMKKVVDQVMLEKDVNYIQFMIHSSELMPGGSPNFEDEYSVDCLYNDLEELFDYIRENGCIGSTFKAYISKGKYEK